MSFVAQLQVINNDETKKQLSRLDGNRPVIVDGSISEILTRALQLAYKKDDDAITMNQNSDASEIKDKINDINPDVVTPQLEGFQEREEQIRLAALKLANAIDAKDNNQLVDSRAKPILVYAVPANMQVTEEYKNKLDIYQEIGANPEDFVFTYIEDSDVNLNPNQQLVDVSDTVKDYEKKGAIVYHSLNEFLDRIADVRVNKR